MKTTVTLDGAKLDVEFNYYQGEKSTPDCAGEPEEYEILSVSIAGHDISNLLAMDTDKRIVAEIEKMKGEV